MQINFNSWHYADSNLWASLIAKIFDELKRYGDHNNAGRQVDTLFQQLNTTKELLEERKADLTVVERKMEEIQKKKKIVQESISRKEETLKGISLAEIVKTVMHNPEVTEGIDKLKKEYTFLDIKNYDDVEENLANLRGGFNKTLSCLQFIYSLRTGRKKWLVVIIFVLISSLIYYFDKSADWFKQHSYFIVFLFSIT